MKPKRTHVNHQSDCVNFLDLTNVLKRLLDLCGQYVTAKRSNLTHWHPVLGKEKKIQILYKSLFHNNLHRKYVNLINNLCLYFGFMDKRIHKSD